MALEDIAASIRRKHEADEEARKALAERYSDEDECHVHACEEPEEDDEELPEEFDDVVGVPVSGEEYMPGEEGGVSEHDIQIDIFDMKGSLVEQLARGKYKAGHYAVVWDGGGAGSREGSVGSSVYIVQMKANNFDKRLKLIKVR